MVCTAAVISAPANVKASPCKALNRRNEKQIWPRAAWLKKGVRAQGRRTGMGTDLLRVAGARGRAGIRDTGLPTCLLSLSPSLAPSAMKPH